MGHNRVLISNRGEIAIRIAKAASALGMESVSVHPPADELSLHTRATTKTVAINPTDSSPASSSDPVAAYLDIEAMIEIAKTHDCDCVHPGYGFLAENQHFAARCAEEGITFVGPPPEALALFGDKVRARTLAKSLDIPVIDGSAEPLTTIFRPAWVGWRSKTL